MENCASGIFYGIKGCHKENAFLLYIYCVLVIDWQSKIAVICTNRAMESK